MHIYTQNIANFGGWRCHMKCTKIQKKKGSVQKGNQTLVKSMSL